MLPSVSKITSAEDLKFVLVSQSSLRNEFDLTAAANSIPISSGKLLSLKSNI